MSTEQVGRAATVFLVVAAQTLAARYVYHANPTLSAALPVYGLRGLPLALAAIYCGLVARRWRAISGADERALLVVSGGWLVAVAVAALRCDRAPSFYWGSLFPYFFAGALLQCASWAQPRWRDVEPIFALTAAALAGGVVLDALGLSFVNRVRAPGAWLWNRNFAGEALALLLPATLAWCARRRAALLLLALVGLALGLTRCRTALWGALAGAVVAIAVVAPSQRRALVVALLPLILGVGLAAAPTRLQWKSSYRDMLAGAADVSSGSGALRLRQYLATLDLMRGRWLAGVGPGAWEPEIEKRGSAVGINRVPSSDFLRVLADGGAATLLLHCALFVVAARAGWRRRRARPAGLACVATMATLGLADACLYRFDMVVLFFWQLAALTQCKPASDSTREPSGVGAWHARCSSRSPVDTEEPCAIDASCCSESPSH